MIHPIYSSQEYITDIPFYIGYYDSTPIPVFLHTPIQTSLLKALAIQHIGAGLTTETITMANIQLWLIFNFSSSFFCDTIFTALSAFCIFNSPFWRMLSIDTIFTALSAFCIFNSPLMAPVKCQFEQAYQALNSWDHFIVVTSQYTTQLFSNGKLNYFCTFRLN